MHFRPLVHRVSCIPPRDLPSWVVIECLLMSLLLIWPAALLGAWLSQLSPYLKLMPAMMLIPVIVGRYRPWFGRS